MRAQKKNQDPSENGKGRPSLEELNRPFCRPIGCGESSGSLFSPYFAHPQAGGTLGCAGAQHGTGQQTVTGTCLHTTRGTHRVTV